MKIDNFVMKHDEIRFKEFQEALVGVLCKFQIARWLAVDGWAKNDHQQMFKLLVAN